MQVPNYFNKEILLIKGAMQINQVCIQANSEQITAISTEMKVQLMTEVLKVVR